MDSSSLRSDRLRPRIRILVLAAVSGLAISAAGRDVVIRSAGNALGLRVIVPPAQWRIVGTGPVSQGGMFSSQIRIAPDGVPHLAYQDFTAPAHRVAVRRFELGAWSPLTLQGAGSTGEAWYNRMAFQDDGALVLATRDYGVGGRLGVRRCAGPNQPWMSLGGDAVSPLDAHYTDIVVLPNDSIAVAFQDRATIPPDRMSVLLWRGGAWSPISREGVSVGISAYSSLAVGPHGRLFAGFTDAAYGAKACVRAWRPSTNHWYSIGQQGFTPDVPNNLVVRIAPDGTPYVAYYVWSTRIVVRRFDGVTWSAVGAEVDGTDVPTVETEGWRQWLGFEIDAEGRPVVAYEALNRGRKAVVKRFETSSGTWQPLGIEGFTPGAADYLSLALAPDGTPYVAFRDGVTGRAAVMVYR